MMGDASAAANLIESAMKQWAKSEDWIDALDIPLAATGTAFHLVLASRHAETFTRLRRTKLLGLCRGAAAITKALAQCLSNAPDNVSCANSKHAENAAAITSAFGHDCAEITVLKHITAVDEFTRAPRELHFLGDRWSDEARRTPPEIRPLVDAAFLTAGLHILPITPQPQKYRINSFCKEADE